MRLLLSRAVTVTLNEEPLVALAGPVTVKCTTVDDVAYAPMRGGFRGVPRSKSTAGPTGGLREGCTVGERATIRESVLWDGVKVGDDVTIDEAIIASRARIGAGAKISRGSVIGHDAVVAPGAILEENARFGDPPK